MVNEKNPAEAEASLRDFISRLDVDAVGIASLAHWQGTKLEETAKKLLPQARSVVVMAMEIYPEVVTLSRPERITGAPSMDDLLLRHMDFLNGRLNKAVHDIAKACRNSGLKALPLTAVGCPSDARFLQAVFSYKHAAQAAGLGRIGWHSLLITPDFGSRARLACCLTEAELEPTSGSLTIKCESCNICVDNCPAKALEKPGSGAQYAINKFACNAFRSAAGGCAECMRLCPMGG